MRSAEEYDAVCERIAAGMTDLSIEAEPGVPRPTVSEWRRRPRSSFSAFPAGPYCYLLGLYLGDGCIAAVLARSDNSVEVGLYSKHWVCIFPQHGPGKKHHRVITLEPWQEDLVNQAPRQSSTPGLVRGLIHSDGCRVIANDRGVRSVRYHFTNYSEDILAIFTRTLDFLSIPWTRSSSTMIAVYRKAATARLDEFVGPKA